MTKPQFLLYMPSVFISYFYIFCAGSTLYLGYYPSYNNPDPNNVLNELPIFTVYLAFWIACGTTFFYGCKIFSNGTIKNLKLLGQVLFFIGLLYFDPGGLFEWFLD